METVDIQQIFQAQKQYQTIVKQSSAQDRIAKLQKLKKAILYRKDKIRLAMYNDFHKPDCEVDLTEIFSSVTEIDFAIKNLKKWMRPQKVATPLALFGTKSKIVYEPRGLVLCIGPWNYPFSLIINPLVAAVSAGNCVVVKPSELTQHTSQLLKEIIEDVFETKEVALIQGSVEVSTALLELPFNHIFFTGSINVGKVVMQAASKHLASVNLELGGKSPAIIDETAHLPTTVERIAWGKFVNGGQTCVAPDYILVHEDKYDDFIKQFCQVIHRFYGKTNEQIKQTKDFSCIINQRNFDRLKDMVQQSVSQGAHIEIGGDFDREQLFIAPTVLTKVTTSMPIMAEEIFGPILPVLTYQHKQQIYEVIESMTKPLALYIFSESQESKEDILAHTTAGGTCINDALIHLGNPYLPFGGVGHSGQNNYHGHFGFKAFSHQRAVMSQSRLSVIKYMYPPYKTKARKVIAALMKFFAS